jgi:hypothetical protein
VVSSRSIRKLRHDQASSSILRYEDDEQSTNFFKQDSQTSFRKLHQTSRNSSPSVSSGKNYFKSASKYHKREKPDRFSTEKSLYCLKSASFYDHLSSVRVLRTDFNQDSDYGRIVSQDLPSLNRASSTNSFQDTGYNPSSN